jgi:hypothetical protein
MFKRRHALRGCTTVVRSVTSRYQPHHGNIAYACRLQVREFERRPKGLLLMGTGEEVDNVVIIFPNHLLRDFPWSYSCKPSNVVKKEANQINEKTYWVFKLVSFIKNFLLSIDM